MRGGEPHTDPWPPRKERATSPPERKINLAATITSKAVSWLQLWTSWWRNDGLRLLCNARWYTAYRSLTIYWVTSSTERKISLAATSKLKEDSRKTIIQFFQRSHLLIVTPCWIWNGTKHTANTWTNQSGQLRSLYKAADDVTIGRLARWIKWRACDVGEAKEGLENELWRRWSNKRVGEWTVT